MDARTLVIGISILLASLVAGAGAVVYVDFVKGSTVLISALPFVFALGMLLVFDKRKLFILVLLFRASGDLVLEMTRFGGGIGVGGLINALIIFLALLFVVEKPNGVVKKSMSIWGPLLLVGFAAMLYAPELKTALRAYLALVSYAAVFVIAFYVVRTREEFEQFITIILLSSIIPTLYAFVDIASHGGGVFSSGFRLQSTFSHPNILAFYLVLNISLLFYRLKTSLREGGAMKRMVYWMYMGLLFGLLLLTQTRSAWAATAVIFGIYGLMFERRYLVYMLLVSLVALAVPSVRDRIMELGQGNTVRKYSELNSFAWRQYLWQTALDWMAISKSAFGYGLTSFRHYSPIFFPLAGNTNFGAHSVYIQWFFETGAVGVLAAAWMYFRLFLTSVAGWAKDRLGTVIVIMLLVEYLFFAFSDNMLDYLAFNWYYWFFIGAACSLAWRAQMETDDEGVTRREPSWSDYYPRHNFLKSNRQHAARS